MTRANRGKKENNILPVEKKYLFYENAVQDPEFDVEFFEKVYEELRGKKALKLREDFCGTFFLSSTWVCSDPEREAFGYDNSEEPTDYGKKHHYEHLSSDQKSRLHIKNEDVRNVKEKNFDLAIAGNFSYFCFHSREELKVYIEAVYRSLDKDGLFIADHFGGPDNARPNIEEKDIEVPSATKKVVYQWDMDYFDPITNRANYYIHFREGRTKYDRAYTYEWRMWSLPEITEIMKEVGFKDVRTYWENDDGDLEYRTEGDIDLDSWIVQIVGLK